MSEVSHGLSWADMHPAEFDGSKATRKQRQFIAEASDTLFPRLMPEHQRRAAKAERQELPGQDDLFGGQL